MTLSIVNLTKSIFQRQSPAARACDNIQRPLFSPSLLPKVVDDTLSTITEKLPSTYTNKFSTEQTLHNLEQALKLCNEKQNTRPGGDEIIRAREGNVQVEMSKKEGVFCLSKIIFWDKKFTDLDQTTQKYSTGGFLTVRNENYIFDIADDTAFEDIEPKRFVSATMKKSHGNKNPTEFIEELKLKGFIVQKKVNKSTAQEHDIYMAPYLGQPLDQFFNKPDIKAQNKDYRIAMGKEFILSSLQLLKDTDNNAFDIKIPNLLIQNDHVTISDYFKPVCTPQTYPPFIRHIIEELRTCKRGERIAVVEERFINGVLLRPGMRYLEIIITTLDICTAGSWVKSYDNPNTSLAYYQQKIEEYFIKSGYLDLIEDPKIREHFVHILDILQNPPSDRSKIEAVLFGS